MFSIVFNKKGCTVIALLVLLASLSLQLNIAYSAEETVFDTRAVVNFLRDVVELDMTKYAVTLVTKATNYWPELGGVAQTTGQYRLDSTGFIDSDGECGTSILTVTFSFWDDKLISLFIYEKSRGPRLYSKQPVTDLSDDVSGFLKRYQTYTEDNQLSQMRSLLNTVDVASNTTRTDADNLSLNVKVKPDNTYLVWSNTLNGVGYNRLSLGFDNWGLSKFYDDRSFYKLGSSEVNISQEEAVNIALKRVESYQYTSEDKETPNFNIVEEHIRSHLSFLNRTDRFVEYPCWVVDLPFDKIHSGGFSYIEVMLWTDSGEVVSVEALGADYPYEETGIEPNLSTEDSGSNNGTGPSAVYIFAACAAIIIPITLIAVSVKRRRK